jgi:Tfp pilus assembly protein PilO
MKLSKREIVLLFVAVIVLAGFLYYTYYYKPYQAEAARLKTTIEEQRQMLDLEKLEKTQIATQAQRIAELTAELEGQLESIPTGVDEPALLVFLEGAVSDLSTNHSIKFAVETKSLGYCQINTVTINLSTSYPNLLTILRRLENAPYRNRILIMTVDSKVTRQSAATEETAGEEEATEEVTVEPVMVEPYLLEVYLSIDFFSFSGSVDPNKEYDFMTGVYDNTDLFPVPAQVVWYYPAESETTE